MKKSYMIARREPGKHTVFLTESADWTMDDFAAKQFNMMNPAVVELHRMRDSGNLPGNKFEYTIMERVLFEDGDVGHAEHDAEIRDCLNG